MINIETNAMATVQASFNQYKSDGSVGKSMVTYYVYNSADRGANIFINSSTFSYNRFCKGMIVYRPAFYDGITNSLLNYTNLYMTYPFKNGSNSSITLWNSNFQSQNTLTNVTALALTGTAKLTMSL